MAMDDTGRSGQFVSVTSTDLLDELFLRSHDSPVILFKHSLTCPISAAANREMQKLPHEVSLVVMQDSRDVSLEVEKRTAIRHESPQVIILRNGVAVWNASHWKIKADAVERAVDQNK